MKMKKEEFEWANSVVTLAKEKLNEAEIKINEYSDRITLELSILKND